jgi:hypothetical protein
VRRGALQERRSHRARACLALLTQCGHEADRRTFAARCFPTPAIQRRAAWVQGFSFGISNRAWQPAVLLVTRRSIVVTVRRLLLASESAKERRHAPGAAAVVSSALFVITTLTALQVSDRKRLASPHLARSGFRHAADAAGRRQKRPRACRCRNRRAAAARRRRPALLHSGADGCPRRRSLSSFRPAGTSRSQGRHRSGPLSPAPDECFATRAHRGGV